MPCHQVNKALGRLVRSLVESTKAFVRWMDGTCIETPEQAGLHDEDEPILFTFYWDVAANPQVRTPRMFTFSCDLGASQQMHSQGMLTFSCDLGVSRQVRSLGLLGSC